MRGYFFLVILSFLEIENIYFYSYYLIHVKFFGNLYIPEVILADFT